jgi:hypothetical protein
VTKNDLKKLVIQEVKKHALSSKVKTKITECFKTGKAKVKLNKKQMMAYMNEAVEVDKDISADVERAFMQAISTDHVVSVIGKLIADELGFSEQDAVKLVQKSYKGAQSIDDLVDQVVDNAVAAAQATRSV